MCEKKCISDIQNFRVSVFRAYGFWTFGSLCDLQIYTGTSNYRYHSVRILVWSKIVTQSIIIEVKIRYKSMVDVHGNIIDVWGDCVVRL